MPDFDLHTSDHIDVDAHAPHLPSGHPGVSDHADLGPPAHAGPYVVEHDYNDDGRVDEVRVDTNHDGRPELRQLDTNNDGVLDTLDRDTNGDGVYDQRDPIHDTSHSVRHWGPNAHYGSA